MIRLFPDDWGALFRVDTPLVELFLRGTLVYFAIFFLLRIFRRETGSLGISDLIVIVVIADAAQNAMSGDYKSITDGVMLVGTIVLWNYVLDWLAFHSPAMRRIISPPPRMLVEDGRIIASNLQKELISKEELKAALRQEGVDDLSKVKAARIEASGEISVIEREDGDDHKRTKGSRSEAGGQGRPGGNAG